MAKNKPSHPLISCGSKSIGKDGVSSNPLVSGLTDNIFAEFLNEPGKNPMSVGRGSVRSVSMDRYVLYKPHNYRLYIDFKKDGLVLPSKEGLYTRGSVSCKYRVVNSVEPCFDDFFGCRIVVHKKTIEINNKLDMDKSFKLSFGGRAEIESQVRDILSQKDDECFEALKNFIDMFGGSSSFKIVNVHSEEKILSEDSIDMIPRKMKFHSPLVKKVYNEQNVEFSDSVSVVNFLENRALESVSPDIVSALKLLALKVTPPVERVKEKIRDFKDIFSLHDEIYSLEYNDRLVLSEWISLTFGGGVYSSL